MVAAAAAGLGTSIRNVLCTMLECTTSVRTENQSVAETPGSDDVYDFNSADTLIGK